MAQQVNLCLPVLRKQKSRFAAQSLIQMMAALMVLGGALSAVWVSNLNQAGASLKVVLANQTKELDGLRSALEKTKQSTAPAEQARAQELKTLRAALQQREQVLAALSQGLFQSGYGHAARLQLVAQSIPSVAWVTEVKADERRLEVRGYTLEPSALNDWLTQLAASVLLQGQSLSTVRVERVKAETLLGLAAAPATAKADNPALAASGRSAVPAVLPPLWSFSLLSSLTPAPASKAVTGGKP